jgi:hypothetical protein
LLVVGPRCLRTAGKQAVGQTGVFRRSGSNAYFYSQACGVAWQNRRRYDDVGSNVLRVVRSKLWDQFTDNPDVCLEAAVIYSSSVTIKTSLFLFVGMMRYMSKQGERSDCYSK